MAQVIQFGKEADNFFRALQDVLGPYFATDQQIKLGPTTLSFKQSKLIFGVDNIPDEPSFSFTLTDCRTESTVKCAAPSGSTATHGFLNRSRVICAVNFQCNNKRADSATEGILFAQSQWGCLSAVLHYEIKKLHDNGIYDLDFDRLPVRMPHPHAIYLFGNIVAKMETIYSVNES